jgi:hypothetical protein
MSMKNSNDTIGNRSDDLPVCSAVVEALRSKARVPTKICTSLNRVPIGKMSLCCEHLAN